MPDERDPLEVVLYRLTALEHRLDSVMTRDLWEASNDRLRDRIEDLEEQQDETRRANRQILIGLIIAIGTAAFNAIRLTT